MESLNRQLAFQAHRRLRKNETSPPKETAFAKMQRRYGRKQNQGRSAQRDQGTGIMPVQGKKTGLV